MEGTVGGSITSGTLSSNATDVGVLVPVFNGGGGKLGNHRQPGLRLQA